MVDRRVAPVDFHRNIMVVTGATLGRLSLLLTATQPPRIQAADCRLSRRFGAREQDKQTGADRPDSSGATFNPKVPGSSPGRPTETSRSKGFVRWTIVMRW